MSQQYSLQARLMACFIFVSVSTPTLAAPALNQFIQNIWQDNPAIQAGQSALEAAKLRKKSANQAIYNPEVEVDVERTDINTLSIGVSQAIDWGNKRGASTNKADAEIQIAQAQLQQQKMDVAEAILVALSNLQSVNNLQKLAEQRVNLMQEFVDNTEKREQAGDVGLQDVALARVALSEAKMQYANSAALQARYKAELQAAANIMLNQWPELSQEPPSPVADFDAEAFIQQLPNIKSLMAQLVAARSNIDLSKAETKADPSFGVRGGMDGNNALLGLSFSMPLYVRNTYRANVEVANQEALQVEQTLLYAARQAQAHISGSHQRYKLTYDAWQSWKKNGLNSLNEQLELIQTIWKSGEMSTADYLVQAKQNVDAQETAVELAAQMWEAWIEWLVASGQIENWINTTK